MPTLNRSEFISFVEQVRGSSGPGRAILAPLALRLLSDQLTPVLAYRRLVAPDERTAPSFLLESVEGGERVGRFSLLGAHPVMEIVAYGADVRITDRRGGGTQVSQRSAADPMAEIKKITGAWRYAAPPGGARSGALPDAPLGGWFGYAGYDTVRYAEPERLDLASAPPDDRNLPDLHFGFYDEIVIFDHVEKLIHVVRLVEINPDEDAGAKYDAALESLGQTVRALETHSKPLPSGRFDRDIPRGEIASNLTASQHADMVERAKEYIRAGDIFQVVVGQRFQRRSVADPFDVYRALRAVNPSPYMVYMQAEGVILAASSPEILCRVRRDRASGARIVTNRPLAGTRKRGASEEEDAAMEKDLLSDEKERAEHIMLVDLGRNDIGKVCMPRTVNLEKVMEIERYSHVMHISSTVTGQLRDDLDCWDALRAALPVGTISGAPKIRAMQIIDELEPIRRGPYGGGMGYVSLEGDMDIALALRTMVIPVEMRTGGAWTYHLQAAGGIVADSQPEAERQETVNKAAALAHAIDVAESAFTRATD